MTIEKCEEVARELMKLHGLEDWVFKFDDSIRRFGYCQSGKRTISMSWKLVNLNDEARVRLTILHEIAHALCPNCHHNLKWKMTLIRIGGNGERCYTTANTIIPKAKFKGECPNCHHVITAHRRNEVSCSKCEPRRFNPDYLFIWSAND